jgi:hypothetical protein
MGGTIINPLFASLYTAMPGGANPTGNQLSLGGSSSSAVNVANPLLPNVNLSTSAPVSSNPYDVTANAPAFPANTSPYATTGSTAIGATPTPGQPSAAGTAISGGMSQQEWTQLFNTLKKTYGFGDAEALVQFLEGGAGYSQEALNNILASLQPGIQAGEENLMSQFSASGNRFGSGSQLGLANFLSQVNLNEGQISAEMYEQAVSNYMNVLMGTAGTNAQRIMSSPSTLDSILGISGLVSQGAGAISGLTSAVSPSTDTGILDAIAAAGAI